MKLRMTALVIAGACASPAIAGDHIVLQPVQVGSETVRYFKGVPTLDLQRPGGAIQVTPLPMDHGGLAFSIAVFNAGTQPANIDITSFAAHAGPQQLSVLSRDQLDAKVRHRAMWAQIALAAAGGLGAAAAASQRDYYHSSLVTPRGVYRATYSAPSAAGQIEAVAIAGSAGIGIATIQSRLDQARAAIGDTTVQLTTVDPQNSYAGRIVLTKIRKPVMPQRVDIVVSWNGADYPFAFQLAKDGTPAPVFTGLTQPPAPPTTPASAGSVPTAPAATPSIGS